MKNLILIGLIFVSTTLISQPVLADLAAVSNLVNDPQLSSARISFCVLDLNTSQVLHKYESEKAVIPASLQKIATTITALETLGANHTFETQLYYSGSISNGVLNGDLVLIGGGDPTLASEYFNSSSNQVLTSFANAIVAAGIKHVKGDILIDETYFDNDLPSSWSWEDVGNYYAAPARSFNFADNRIALSFTTGPPGTNAIFNSLNPKIEGFEIESKVISADITIDDAFCFAAPDAYQMVVKGRLPANKKDFTIKAALPQPGIYFGKSLIHHMSKMGISVDGKTKLLSERMDKNELKLIFQLASPTVLEIVKVTNHHSINLFAEALMKHAALKSTEQLVHESEFLHKFWKTKLSSSQGFMPKDGSGLSHFNTITSNQLCEMLLYVYKGKNGASFKSSLPVSGKSGTMGNFGKGTILENNFAAKSGYMTGQRGYAGYVKLKSGREVAIALIANNYDISAGAMRKKMQEFLADYVADN